MRSLFWIALTMLFASVIASHRSVYLDSFGFYRGLVVGFSDDYNVEKDDDKVQTVNSLMTRLQDFSDILYRLLGVRIGEVTIVLPDSWSISSRLNVSKEAFQNVPRRTLSEADIIFTDDANNKDSYGKEQILTMQWGDCGEPALPIHIQKTYFLDFSGRLLAHQWMLYRYGVFNEFGLVKDDTYPVYFRPIDAGQLNSSTAKSLPNTCADSDVFSKNNDCGNMEVEPSSGNPLKPTCDLIPMNDSIHSSFLYAPLAVSESDYRICNASTHDYLAPNKQNIICDNRSPLEVIRSHKDFEEFPLGGKPNLPPSQSIKFKIWTKHPPKPNVDEKSRRAHIFYALPQGFKFTGDILSMLRLFSADFFKHMAKFALFNGETIGKLREGWLPSENLPLLNPVGDQEKTVNLNTIFNKIISEFDDVSSRIGGTIVFVHSGSHSDPNMADSNIILDKLVEKLNKESISLKVLIIEKIPEKKIIDFFDRLTKQLTSGKSSVYYAVPSQASNQNTQSRVVPEMLSFIFDTLQDETQQSHILIKRETFSVEKEGNLQMKFSIDNGFARTNNLENRWLFIEVYSPEKKQILFENAQFYSAYDQSHKINEDYADGRGDHLAFFVYRGSKLKPGIEYIFNVPISYSKMGSNVAIAARMFSTYNAYRSYYSEAPVTGTCWIQPATNRSPLRGYVQLGQGWNGPIYDASVTMIIRRFTTSGAVQEFQIPMADNELASPDLTKNDGIYSSYLDSAFNDFPDGDVVFQVSARVTSSRFHMKPGNFGNTLMFFTKQRCCGSTLGNDDEDEEISGPRLERVLDCGSFHLDGHDSSMHNGFTIRDLRVRSINPENRTVTIEWNSPFMPHENTEHSGEVKFFYSKNLQTNLPMTIKEKFAAESGADIELVENSVKPVKKRSAQSSSAHSESLSDNILESGTFLQDEEESFPFDENSPIHDRNLQQEIQLAKIPVGNLTNSKRTATFKVNQPEAGYYFIAVQERDGLKQTRPSNVIIVYLKSNVKLDKNNAFAIEQGQMTEGPYSSKLDNAGLGWEMVVLICVGCALLLIILILVAICFTIRRHRQNSKETDAKTYDSGNIKNSIHETTKSIERPRPAQQYYIGLQNGQQPDRSSLQSENGLSIHGSQGPASQHTSSTEVNQVHDHGNNPAPYYQSQYQNSEHSPTISNKQMKELNVATLLPNSWDAKDLLDHWGRVQEAKQRQEMPGMLQTTAMPAHSTSDEDTPSPYSGQHSSQPGMYYSSHPAQAYMYDGDELYHQSHIPQQQQHSAHYSPYSNASSIWQHHQQQQQQPPPPQQHRMAFHHPQSSYPMGAYDESGLPEYSVVRKVPVVSPQPNPPNHANISQV